tara:strand:+ start:78 stop:536 length:459 start_codon:yes stop_codon:yes gene_type:complete
MSTVEDRKKERFKKILASILDSNPVTAIARRINKKAFDILKGKLTKEKEITLESIISDLKLSTGDRGAAEAMPKKKFDESVAFRKRIRDIQGKMKPAPMPMIKTPKTGGGPAGITQQEMRKKTGSFNMAKDGSVKTYAKGGGVRKPKMTAGY